MIKHKRVYLFIFLLVGAFMSYSCATHAVNSNDSSTIHNAQMQINDFKETEKDGKSSTQVIVIKDEREANNQHDWVFYILNILITSSLTLLINYLNSKFEIIKMQNEPSIDRLKTIAIEGIKTEKKIYTDLKSAQEHLSYGRKEDALKTASDISNFLEENKMDVKPSLYINATDIISYITSVAQGKNIRSELRESQLFEAYFKEYRK
jgi:predicted RND superfamily exporter protein